MIHRQQKIHLGNVVEVFVGLEEYREEVRH